VAFETHIPKPCHKMLNPTMWYMKFAFQKFQPKMLSPTMVDIFQTKVKTKLHPTSGNAQFMHHKSPLWWFLFKDDDMNSNIYLDLLMAQHSMTTSMVQSCEHTNTMLNCQKI